MDLGSLFGGIGNFIGSIFGANQKKKQDPTQPQPAVQPPTIAPVQLGGSQSSVQNTVKVPQPFALPTPVASTPTLGGVNQLQATPAPASTPAPAPAVAAASPVMPQPFPLSAQAVSNQFQQQRQQEAANAATPAAPNPLATRLGNAANNSVLDTLNLVNSNPVSHFVASIPQGIAQGGIRLANDFGANIGTNITDPVTKALLDVPSGNVGNSVSSGNASAASIDSLFGNGQGNGLSTAPQSVKTGLGVASDILSVLPLAPVLKPVRAGVGALSDLIRGARAVDGATEAAPAVESSVVGSNKAAVPGESAAPEVAQAVQAPREASPVVAESTANEPPAITSTNQPAASTVPAVSAPATVVQPKPIFTAPVTATDTGIPAELGGVTTSTPTEVPTIQASRAVAAGKPSVRGASNAVYNTEDPNLQQIARSAVIAAKGTAKTADEHAAALDAIGLNASDAKAIRNFVTQNADSSGHIDGDALNSFIQKRLDTSASTPAVTPNVKTAENAPIAPQAAVSAETPSVPAATDAIENATKGSDLGSIAKNAVIDGSINTPEGRAAIEQNVAAAADSAAKEAGTTVADINAKAAKGYDLWKSSKGKLTEQQAMNKVDGFTSQQQAVSRNLAEELNTVRERSGVSLGGDQGRYYYPRQLADSEYNPAFINEIRRGNVDKGSGLAAGEIDNTITPAQHYIRRYTNGSEGATQQVTDIVEKTPDGAPTGLKVTDKAKADFAKSVDKATQLRDKAATLASNGDVAGARVATNQAKSTIDKAISDFGDAIPGTGADKKAAVRELTELRKPYSQTTVQSVALSNVPNQIANQGVPLLNKIVRPLRSVADKALRGKYIQRAVNAGSDGLALDTSRSTIQASREFASGLNVKNAISDLKSGVTLAGSGRNPVVKGIAKADAAFNGTLTGVTRLGDVEPDIAARAAQLALSKPEAQGLKTVAEKRAYLQSVQNSNEFKSDYNDISAQLSPATGIPGANGGGSGPLSKALGKLDNLPKNFFNSKGINNRLIDELNGFWKTYVTGYAGVGTRVLENLVNSATFKGLRDAAKFADSGVPGAAAKAAQSASQSLVDAAKVYGGAGAAIAALKTGLIGYTGNYPSQDKSQAAYNKAHNVPANQFYVNVGGNRVYFSLSRALGAAGTVADVVGAAVGGGASDLLSGAYSALGELYNQAGGTSIPQKGADVAAAFNPNNDPDQRAAATNTALQDFTPSFGIVKNAANVTDGTKRQTNNVVDAVKAQIPGLREQLPAATDSQGNVIPNSKQASGGSSLFSIGDNPDQAAANGQPADAYQDVLNKFQQNGHDVFPTTQSKGATGKNIDTLGNLLVRDPVFTNASEDEQAAMLKGVAAGTTGKNISSTLAPQDQQALLDGELLGNKKAVWLDDNKNNANYQTATFNNAQANGTLTEADKDITNPSGLEYKMVAAQVDQKVNATYQLKNNYANTSQSEFRELLNPKSDTYDTDAAQTLYNYDQARVAAGLPPKFNLAKAQAANAKSNGVGNNFSFANLPSSLIGNDASSSTGGKSYADPASLFTPIADLKVPVGEAVPKGRTISVKTGVQI